LETRRKQHNEPCELDLDLGCPLEARLARGDFIVMSSGKCPVKLMFSAKKRNTMEEIRTTGELAHRTLRCRTLNHALLLLKHTLLLVRRSFFRIFPSLRLFERIFDDLPDVLRCEP
jgi:hypothetical protein